MQLRSADGVCLGDDGDAARNAKQFADGHMLDRLRHYALVGRYHQHYGRDTTRACEHVADEEAMTRYVNKAYAERRSIRRPASQMMRNRGRW